MAEKESAQALRREKREKECKDTVARLNDKFGIGAHRTGYGIHLSPEDAKIILKAIG